MVNIREGIRAGRKIGKFWRGVEKLRDGEGGRRGRIGIRSEFSSITHARKCGKNLIARGGRRGERK